jgi:hypothetical protein
MFVFSVLPEAHDEISQFFWPNLTKIVFLKKTENSEEKTPKLTFKG